MRAASLMYHDVVRGDGEASGFTGPGPARYKLTVEAFLDHLAALERMTAHAPACVDDAIRGRLPGDAWLLTFDDGGASAVETAELLARRGWRAHFFVVTGRLGRAGFMRRDDVRAVHELGHVVGSHSATHPPRISACSPRDLRAEWQDSLDVLAELIGAPVACASVPGGHYAAEVGRAAAACGVRALFTSSPVRRVAAVDGCLLLGRYAIRSHTPAAEAAEAAAGARGRWARQRAAWTLRGVAKTAAGPAYEGVRNRLLSRGEA